MKTMKLELAHVGMFGPDGTPVTRTHLADCAATFDGKCPATLGHKLADWMPKFGNVSSVGLEKGGDSLVGKVEVNDLLADAVDAKFYEDISVGIQKRKADGKHYLHHVAFLGAVPPKIRDLKVFADLGVIYCADDQVDLFGAGPGESEGDTAKNAPAAKIKDAKDKAALTLDEARSTLERLSAWATQMATAGKIPDDIAAQALGLADQLTLPDKEEDVELKEENEALKKELADKKAALMTGAKDGLKKAMEGRVPKAIQGLALELADQLGSDERIELSDEDGKKEKVSGIEVLKRLFEAMPKAVQEGRSDLSDGPEAQCADISKMAGKF